MLSKVLSGFLADFAEPLVIPSIQPNDFRPQEEKATPASPAPATAQNHPDRSAEIAELQAELASLREQTARAERNAFAQGEQHGRGQAKAEIQPVMDRMNASIQEVLDMRPQLRRAAEQDLVRLALAIARRILHRELHVDPAALSGLVRFAFDRIGRAEKYHIRVHPNMAEAVEQSVPRRHDASIQVEADPACALGTLIIRTGGGTIDASVENQLDEISKGLTDRMS